MPLPAGLVHAPIHGSPDTTLAEAAQKMREHGIGSLFLVDDDGRLVGVVTDRDLALRGLTQRLDPASTPVSRVMTSEVYALSADDELVRASSLIRRHRIRRLPILDADRRLTGVITADDLLAHVARALSQAAECTVTGRAKERAPVDSNRSLFGKE